MKIKSKQVNYRELILKTTILVKLHYLSKVFIDSKKVLHVWKIIRLVTKTNSNKSFIFLNPFETFA